MMNKGSQRLIRPIVLIFIFVNALLLTGSSWLANKGIDQSVLIIGNLVIFLASFGSLLISLRANQSASPQAPVRSMYVSFMIKFFLIAITALVYIMVVKKDVNKPALIACAALYIIYSILEVAALTKMLKNKKNA